MDINAEANQNTGQSGSGNRKGFFDPVEIKGLSPKSAREFSSGRFSRLLHAISRLLAFTPSRVYGLIFMTFGVLTLFLHLGEYYFMADPAVEVSSLVIGAVFIILSLLLLASDKPICIALQSVKLVDFVVFEFFSINRMQESEGEHKLGAPFGILFGAALSALGFFFPTEYAALVIIGLVFLTVAMVSPEFAYIFSLLIFPYLSLVPYSTYILAALICLTLISFARKVLVGKRIYSFEIYDFLFLFLIIAVLITGVILGGSASTERAILIILFVIGYIPSSNLAVNRRLFDCVSGAIVASSIPIVAYSVIRYVIEAVFYERRASRAFFDSPEILAAYLSAVIIFSLYLSVKRSRNIKKRYYFSVFLLSSVALLTTECFAIPIALIIGLLSFAVIRSEGIPRIILVLLLALPFSIFLLPDTALIWISDPLSITPTLVEIGNSMWDSIIFFSENIFLGMGVNVSGSADFSHNSYLAFASRFGILAVMALTLLLVLRVLHLGAYKRYYSDSAVNFYVDMSTVAVVSILVFGSFSDIFAQVETVYFFTVIFAMGSGALRISKKEKEELLSYYRDLGSSDSAAIDVSLRK